MPTACVRACVGGGAGCSGGVVGGGGGAVQCGCAQLLRRCACGGHACAPLLPVRVACASLLTSPLQDLVQLGLIQQLRVPGLDGLLGARAGWWFA